MSKSVTWADLNPVALSWAKMMDDDLILPKNKKIIKKKNKTVNPDGSITEVVEYDDITYFYDKYDILQQKTTKKIDIKKTKKLHRSVADRKENRLLFGDAIDPKNYTLTQNLGYLEMLDPKEETDENEVIDRVTSGFANVMQKLARRKLESKEETIVRESETPKNTYVPPHLRNKENKVDEGEEKSKSVKVDNFPYETTEEDLHLLFSVCGKIRNRNCVFIHPSGNFAFINYESHQEALKAVEMVHNHIYGSLYLNVELARPRVKKEETNKKTGYGEKLAQQGRYSFVTNSNKKY